MLKATVSPTIYTPIIDSIFTEDPYGAPVGKFYLLFPGKTVPTSPRPTTITIETDRVGEPLEINVVHIENPPDVGVLPPNKPSILNIVPSGESVTVSVQLGQGRNDITISTRLKPIEITYLIIYTNEVVSLWEAFARDFFTNVTRVIDNEKTAINSPFGIRLVESFLVVQDLLPDTQSLKVLTARMLVRGLLHSVGNKSGQDDMLKALSVSTPEYSSMDKLTYDFNPELDPWVDAASQFSGTEAHVWIPNFGIMAWTAFWRFLVANPSNYEIVGINENVVSFNHQGELRRHFFDFDRFGTDFLQSLAREDCFKSIYVSISMASYITFKFCAAAYTFDLFIDKPIGNSRESFDIDVPFDQGYLFDSDSVDPFSNGWLGWSLSGRFEQRENQPLAFDTFTTPSTSYTGDICMYDGFFTQNLTNTRYDVEMPVNIVVTGEVSPPTFPPNVPPEAQSVAFTGTVKVGSTLNGGYTYFDSNGDLEGTTTFQWYSHDDAAGNGGGAISGATSINYTVDISVQGKYLKLGVTPVALTGALIGSESFSSILGPVLLNASPEAQSVAFTGTVEEGSVLSGSYTYFDPDGDLEGATTFQWYFHNDAAGNGGGAIFGATSINYTVTIGIQDKYFKLGVTPVALTGTLIGSESFSAISTPTIFQTYQPSGNSLETVFDGSDNTLGKAQTIVATEANSFNNMEVRLGKQFSPIGDIYCKIVPLVSEIGNTFTLDHGGSLGISNPVDVGSIPTSPVSGTLTSFVFPSTISLTIGNSYAFIFYGGETPTINLTGGNVDIGKSNFGPYTGGMLIAPTTTALGPIWTSIFTSTVDLHIKTSP